MLKNKSLIQVSYQLLNRSQDIRLFIRCRTKQIKHCTTSKIVDFTAIFRNFLAAQTNCSKKCIIYFWKVNYISHFIQKYQLFNTTISLWNNIHYYIWKCRKRHTHFFNLAPGLYMLFCVKYPAIIFQPVHPIISVIIWLPPPPLTTNLILE